MDIQYVLKSKQMVVGKEDIFLPSTAIPMKLEYVDHSNIALPPDKLPEEPYWVVYYLEPIYGVTEAQLPEHVR